MELSIIIISYNTNEILKCCLQSIKSSNLMISHEIIVVDNASTDGSADMVEREFPGVILIRNETNDMFAKANNQAMRIASGKYFLFLNSDCLIVQGNIEKLYNFIRTKQPQVACVGPRVLNLDGTLQSEGYPLYTIKMMLLTIIKAKYWGKYFPWYQLFPHGMIQNGRVRKVGWIHGSCMMLEREKCLEIGGFDEGINFYGEEIDLCRRLHDRGYEVWVIPKATIVHLGGKSTTSEIKDRVNVRYVDEISKRAIKIHGKRNAALMWLLIIVDSISKFCFFMILFKFKRGRSELGNIHKYWNVMIGIIKYRDKNYMSIKPKQGDIRSGH